jgi:hypothetical protein
MPRIWVISCHATVGMQTTIVGEKATAIQTIELVPVPVGIRFIHFVPEGLPLDSGVAGWPAYQALMKSPPDLAAVRRISGYTEFHGASLPNYTMTGDAGWIDDYGFSASGVFVAGDTYHRDPMTGYIAPWGSYTLRQFFADPEVKAGDTVYWLCCRVWTRGGSAVSVPWQSATPSSSRPPPAILRPPGRPLPPVPPRMNGGVDRVLASLPPGTIAPVPFARTS